MAKYKMIEVLEMDDDGLYTEINVHYDDGTVTKITGKDNCEDELTSFAMQEGMEIYDLIVSEDKVIYNLTRSDPHIESDEEVPVEEAPTEEPAIDEEDKKGKKGFIKGLKIVASIAALMVVFSCGYHLRKCSGKKVSNRNEITQEDNSYSSKSDYETTSTKVPYYDESNHILNLDSKGLKEERFLYETEYINDLCFYGLNEIGIYVNGGELYGEPLFIRYQNLFPSGSIDYYAVEYYSGLRDNFVRAAYFDNNRNGTKNAVDNFCQKAAGFSAGNETITFATKSGDIMTLSKYDLSPSARQVICLMTMGAYNINESTYVTYNEKNHSPDEVREALCSEYSNTMIELSNRYSR